MEQIQEQLETDVETTESEGESSGKIESVRESVLKAIQENSADSPDDGDQSVQPEKQHNTKQAEQVEKVKDVSEDDLDPDLSPPARLDAKAKQVFNNLPKTLKRAFSKSIRDLEAVTTRGQQEISPLKAKYSRIDELLQPHRAEWAQVGLTDDQAIAELIGTHERLKNPATKEATARWLIGNIGMSHLLRDAEEAAAPSSVANDPYVRQLEQQLSVLQRQVAPVLDIHQQSISQVEAREVQTASQEVHEVQNEKDASGRYRYPRLHDPTFVEQVKPLVVEAVRNVPSLGYGNALRKVYEMFEAPIGTSPAQSRTGLPAQPQQFTNNRSSAAGASVRGRSALPVGTPNGNIDIPPEARGSARDTVAWVIANRGR